MIARSSDPASSGPAPDRTVLLQPGILPQVRWLESLVAGGPAAEASSDATGSFAIRCAADLPGAERWLLSRPRQGRRGVHVAPRGAADLARHLPPARGDLRDAERDDARLASPSGSPAPRSSSLRVPPLQFAGALLFLLHSILDGCDGELARLKFPESRFGGVLDFWGDNVVHSAVFALHRRRMEPRGRGRLCGRSSRELPRSRARLLSAAFVYRDDHAGARTGRPRSSRPSPGRRATRLSRMADALARRDFIYLVVVLAAFGKAHWFLVLAAIGAPALLPRPRRHRRVRRPATRKELLMTDGPRSIRSSQRTSRPPRASSASCCPASAPSRRRSSPACT